MNGLGMDKFLIWVVNFSWPYRWHGYIIRGDDCVGSDLVWTWSNFTFHKLSSLFFWCKRLDDWFIMYGHTLKIEGWVCGTLFLAHVKKARVLRPRSQGLVMQLPPFAKSVVEQVVWLRVSYENSMGHKYHVHMFYAHAHGYASTHVSVLTWETFAAPSIYRCVLACNSVGGGGLSTLATRLACTYIK